MRNEPESEHHCEVSIVNGALSSKLFPAYCVMIDATGTCLEHLSNWAEGCSCHGPNRPFEKQPGVESCPLKTMRAPECAAGEPFKILEDLHQLDASKLVLHPAVVALPEEDMSLMMSDVYNGCSTAFHMVSCVPLVLPMFPSGP